MQSSDQFITLLQAVQVFFVISFSLEFSTIACPNDLFPQYYAFGFLTRLLPKWLRIASLVPRLSLFGG